MTDLIGTKIGRYQLVEELGRNEISSLFKAYDTRLERHVALKLVMRSKDYSAEFIDYFLKEARALAQLSHPNIVKVLDFGQEQGCLYMVTEYVSGQSMQQMLGKAMDWRQAVDLLLPVAEALEYAHNRGVIHRDLKPSNILLNEENQPILSDFSIARIIEEEETREMTGTNVGLGSPFYMSPEQGKGLPTDYRADIYALGIIFFELVTGRKPFEAEVGMEVVIQQVTTQPPSPRKFVPELPEPIEKIILTALKKDPDERFQSMVEWANAVQQVKQSGKYQARRRSKRPARLSILYAVSALVLLAMAGAALWVSGAIPNLQAQLLSPATPTAQQAALPVQSPSPSKTPVEKTAVAAVTRVAPTPTLAPSPTRTAQPTEPPLAYNFPTYPILEGEKFPALAGPITPENLSELVEVARLGSPRVNGLEWSTGDRYIVSGTSAGVFFYNIDGLKTEFFFDAKGWVTAIGLSRDGAQLAAGYNDGMVRTWDALTGKLLFEYPGHTAAITALAFSPDGTLVLSGSQDRTARLWNAKQGGERFALVKHGMMVNDAAFTPDGKAAVTVSDDFQTILWDPASGQILETLRSGARIFNLAISNDGKTLALALNNARVEIWDLETHKLRLTLSDPKQVTPVFGLSFSPNNQLLATACGDSLVRVWNVSSGDMLNTLEAAANPKAVDKDRDQLLTVAYSSDGTRLTSQTVDGYMIVWDMYNRSRQAQRDMKRSQINRVAVSPDGKTLIYQTGSDQVTTWSIGQGKKLAHYAGAMPRGSIVSNNNRWMVLLVNGQLEMYTLNQSAPVKEKTFLGYPPNGSVSFLPGDQILAAAGSRLVTLWSTNTGLQLSSDNYRYDRNCQTAFSESNEFLAAGSTVGVATDEATAQFICGISRNPRAQDETFNTNQYLAFGLDIAQVNLWAQGEAPTSTTIPDGKGKTRAVAVSADGRLLASGSEDGKIRLYDPATGDLLATLDYHTAAILDLAFSADGTMLLSCSEDGSIQIWGLLSS